MARLITSGFEVGFGGFLGQPDVDGVALSTDASQVTTGQRSGSAALRAKSTISSGASVRFDFPSVLGRWYRMRAYIKVTTLPTGQQQIVTFQSTSSAVRLYLNTDGTLQVADFSAVKSAAINDGAWHRIELGGKPSATQASRAWELRLDGVTVASGTNQAFFDDTAYTGFIIGANGSIAAEYLFDDIALNDDQGASENSWPGDGKVVLLVPTGDSAVGAGWTLGTGTAITGGAGAVALSNRPPQGVADLAGGSNTKQIRNATSNANANYDATMTTYAAAGIGASDTIKAMHPLVITAAPVTTSAKAGTVGVVSNPAIANVALGAGGTAGAFWSGVAAGTYPTGWKASKGTTTYSPAVTVSTAPVLRITQVTSSTRIAMVCFAGLYVEYLPAGKTKVLGDTFGLKDARSVFEAPPTPTSAYAAAVLADSPQAYYRLNEASGLPQDSSGYRNHMLSKVGSQVYSQAAALTDGDTAISFPGSSYFSVWPIPLALDINDVFTLEAWVKLNALGQMHGIISFGAGGGYMRVNTANKLQLVRSTTLGMEESTVTLDTNWHHVVVTKNGAAHKVYVDGVDVTGTATADSTCDQTDRGITFGSDDGGNEPANAVLDELAIYSTALSPTRVAAHYAAGLAAPPQNYTRTPADTFGLTDARARAVAAKRTRTETFGLTDARTRIATVKRTRTEVFGLTDARRATHAVTQSDAFGLTDARSFVKGKRQSIGDTLGLTDARTLARVLRRTASESFGLTDARTRAAAFKRTRAETFALTDARRATHIVVQPDALGLTDARTRIISARRTRAETFGLTDAEREARGKVLADALGLTDARTRAAAFRRVRSETFGLTDLASPVKGVGSRALTRTVADAFGLSDARRATYVVARAEGLLLADLLHRVKKCPVLDMPRQIRINL